MSQRFRSIPALFVGVLAGVASLASACSDSGSPTTPSPKAANPDTVKIGLLLTLTGDNAGAGLESKRGAEVAVNQINALGGILGKQVVLDIQDTESNPDLVLPKANQLIANGSTLAIGPTTSDGAIRVADLVKANQILLISPSATSSVLDTAHSDTAPASEGVLLRTAASDSYLAVALAQWASTPPKGSSARRCASIVTVTQNDEYGNPIREAVRNTYKALSLRVFNDISLDPNQASTQTLQGAAAQVASAASIPAGATSTAVNGAAACQIIIAQPRIAGAYMQAFRRATAQDPSARDGAPGATPGAGWSTFVTIGSDGFRQADFITSGRANPAATDPDTAGNGSFAIAADTDPEPENATQDFSAFLNLYRASFARVEERDPGRYGSTTYDAMWLLALGIERAQSMSDIPTIRTNIIAISGGRKPVGPHDVADMLKRNRDGEDINYEGASGPCNFGATGSVLSDFGVWTVENATFNRAHTFPGDELQSAAAK